MNYRPMHHVCYIVDDIPTAVAQWVEVAGAGPFFHLGEHVEFDETLLEGEPCLFDHASAIGKRGPILLELMKLHEVTPELESRLPTGVAGGSNISHIAYIVDDPATEREASRPPGCRSSCICASGRSRSRCTMRRCWGTRSRCTRTADAINGLFALIAAGAEGWDGSEPLRPLPEG